MFVNNRYYDDINGIRCEDDVHCSPLILHRLAEEKLLILLEDYPNEICHILFDDEYSVEYFKNNLGKI